MGLEEEEKRLDRRRGEGEEEADWRGEWRDCDVEAGLRVVELIPGRQAIEATRGGRSMSERGRGRGEEPAKKRTMKVTELSSRLDQARSVEEIEEVTYQLSMYLF